MAELTCSRLGGWVSPDLGEGGNLELSTRALDVITGLLSEASSAGAALENSAAGEQNLQVDARDSVDI